MEEVVGLDNFAMYKLGELLLLLRLGSTMENIVSIPPDVRCELQ